MCFKISSDDIKSDFGKFDANIDFKIALKEMSDSAKSMIFGPLDGKGDSNEDFTKIKLNFLDLKNRYGIKKGSTPIAAKRIQTLLEIKKQQMKFKNPTRKKKTPKVEELVVII